MSEALFESAVKLAETGEPDKPGIEAALRELALVSGECPMLFGRFMQEATDALMTGGLSPLAFRSLVETAREGQNAFFRQAAKAFASGTSLNPATISQYNSMLRDAFIAGAIDASTLIGLELPEPNQSLGQTSGQNPPSLKGQLMTFNQMGGNAS